MSISSLSGDYPTIDVCQLWFQCVVHGTQRDDAPIELLKGKDLEDMVYTKVLEYAYPRGAIEPVCHFVISYLDIDINDQVLLSSNTELTDLKLVDGIGFVLLQIETPQNSGKWEASRNMSFDLQ